MLGGQYNVWTEWIADETKCEEMQFPRALAMAEVLWSPLAGRNFAEFSARQARLLGRLDALGVSYSMPAPRTQYTLVFFRGGTKVMAENPRGGPFTLRYTLDGSVPGPSSPEYTDGIKVTKPCTVTFAYVNSQGKSGDPARVVCRLAEAVPDLGHTKPGLLGARYLIEGEPTRMPVLSSLVPESRFATAVIDDGARPRKEKFAVNWRGYLKVPVAGAYTFWLTSDDGSVLRLNTAIVVDNDGPHGALEKSGTAWLPAGSYLFDLAWFDQGGGNSMRLEVAGPGTKRGPVPGSWLFTDKAPG